jgi:MFS family permease
MHTGYSKRAGLQNPRYRVWALACSMGPLVGGALANSGAWRYLFWINLPLCGIAGVLIALFLRVHTPRESFAEKILRMDWLWVAPPQPHRFAFMADLGTEGIQSS